MVGTQEGPRLPRSGRGAHPRSTRRGRAGSCEPPATLRAGIHSLPRARSSRPRLCWRSRRLHSALSSLALLGIGHLESADTCQGLPVTRADGLETAGAVPALHTSIRGYMMTPRECRGPLASAEDRFGTGQSPPPRSETHLTAVAGTSTAQLEVLGDVRSRYRSRIAPARGRRARHGPGRGWYVEQYPSRLRLSPVVQPVRFDVCRPVSCSLRSAGDRAGLSPDVSPV